jgi:carboxymethylenebutenolidase
VVRKLNVLLLALLGLLGGREARVRAQDARREDTGLTGAVSEDEFKALHERPHDDSPAPRGELLTLGADKAYLSLPPGGAAPRGALEVIHEWWGLNDNVKHWTDRMAAEGYAALAVDLYGGQVATTPDEAMALMKGVQQEQALARLRAAATWLRTDPRARGGPGADARAPKLGVIGWCFGGAQSLQLALNDPDLAAAIIYYGKLETDPERLRSIKAAVLGVFGTRDRSIPQETVDAFDRGLTAAGVTHELHRYDAEHAFANPSNPRYQSEAAAEAWARVRTFLARHLRP